MVSWWYFGGILVIILEYSDVGYLYQGFRTSETQADTLKPDKIITSPVFQIVG